MIFGIMEGRWVFRIFSIAVYTMGCVICVILVEKVVRLKIDRARLEINCEVGGDLKF